MDTSLFSIISAKKSICNTILIANFCNTLQYHINNITLLLITLTLISNKTKLVIFPKETTFQFFFTRGCATKNVEP